MWAKNLCSDKKWKNGYKIVLFVDPSKYQWAINLLAIIKAAIES